MYHSCFEICTRVFRDGRILHALPIYEPAKTAKTPSSYQLIWWGTSFVLYTGDIVKEKPTPPNPPTVRCILKDGVNPDLLNYCESAQSCCEWSPLSWNTGFSGSPDERAWKWDELHTFTVIISDRLQCLKVHGSRPAWLGCIFTVQIYITRTAEWNCIKNHSCWW